MKKHLLFITILLFVFKTGHGQTNVYHPFPDTSAKWNETYWVNNGSANPPYSENYPNIMFLGGDTIISSLHYKKLLSSGYQFSIGAGGPPNCCYYYNTYQGAIRQDSIHKKVYFCNASTTVDTMLYDFNLSVGDTLQSSYINNPFDSNYVSSIDSIFIGTSYRKQYHISRLHTSGFSNYLNLIEGIGSTQGLLYPLNPGFEIGWELNCFSQNSVTTYTNPMGTGCDLALGIKTIKEQVAIFNISPNPSIGNISITGNVSIDELKVSDMLGQIVYEAKPNTANTTLTLNTEGVYFITLTSGTETSTKKVIVSK